MYPKQHIILGALFSLILLVIFPHISLLGFLIIFLSSVLIDIDHYFFYIWTRKNSNLKSAYQWFVKRDKRLRKLSKKKKKEIINPPVIFHGIETIILLMSLSFISPIFFFILTGFMFHQFLDLIGIVDAGYGLSNLGSQIYNILNYTNS